MDDLIAFLRARLDSWELRTTEACRSTGESDEESATWGWVRADRADIESKRLIIEHVAESLSVWRSYTPAEADAIAAINGLERVLILLALPYVGHPDYRSEWRP